MCYSNPFQAIFRGLTWAIRTAGEFSPWEQPLHVVLLSPTQSKGIGLGMGPNLQLSIKTQVKSNLIKPLEAISALYLSEYFKSFSQTMLLTAITSHSTEMFISICTYSLLVVQERICL